VNFLVGYTKALPGKLSGIIRTGQAAINGVDTVNALLSIKQYGIETVMIHGTEDQIVPFASAQSAADLSDGWLIPVPGAYYSWLIANPELGADMIEKALAY
jgi:hypothetical protein